MYEKENLLCCICLNVPDLALRICYLTSVFHSQEANQNQTAKHEKCSSPVQSQAERDLDNYRESQAQAVQKLMQQMKKQVSAGKGVQLYEFNEGERMTRKNSIF